MILVSKDYLLLLLLTVAAPDFGKFISLEGINFFFFI